MKTINFTPEQLRELDAWIAEHVKGYVFTDCPDDSTPTEVRQWCKHKANGQAEWRVLVSEPYRHRGIPKERQFQHSWKNYNPTTAPAAALEVLKKCVQLVEFQIGRDEENGNFYINTNYDGCFIDVEAETLELAICLFAEKLFSNQ